MKITRNKARLRCNAVGFSHSLAQFQSFGRNVKQGDFAIQFLLQPVSRRMRVTGYFQHFYWPVSSKPTIMLEAVHNVLVVALADRFQCGIHCQAVPGAFAY
jgi:hypothetical protein